MKIRMLVYVGGGNYSETSQVVDTEEYFTHADDEWKRLSEEDRMKFIREWALEQIEYYYEEVL